MLRQTLQVSQLGAWAGRGAGWAAEPGGAGGGESRWKQVGREPRGRTWRAGQGELPAAAGPRVTQGSGGRLLLVEVREGDRQRRGLHAALGAAGEGQACRLQLAELALQADRVAGPFVNFPVRQSHLLRFHRLPNMAAAAEVQEGGHGGSRGSRPPSSVLSLRRSLAPAPSPTWVSSRGRRASPRGRVSGCEPSQLPAAPGGRARFGGGSR